MPCKRIFCLEQSSEVSHRVEELGNNMKRECMWTLSCKLLGIMEHNTEESAKLQDGHDQSCKPKMDKYPNRAGRQEADQPATFKAHVIKEVDQLQSLKTCSPFVLCFHSAAPPPLTQMIRMFKCANMLSTFGVLRHSNRLCQGLCPFCSDRCPYTVHFDRQY